MSTIDVVSELEFAYADLSREAAAHSAHCDELCRAIRTARTEKDASSAEVRKYLKDVERFKEAAADSIAKGDVSLGFGSSGQTLQSSAEDALQLAVLREHEVMVKLTGLQEQLSALKRGKRRYGDIFFSCKN